MKKIILSMLALGLLASCSNEDAVLPQISNNDQIQLTAGVNTAVTRSAPVYSTFTEDLPAGIYATNGSWLNGSANWINNDRAIVEGEAGHEVIFQQGPYYYPTDGTMLNFYAFSPYATELTPAQGSQSPVVRFNITGQEDVMWATATGSKKGSDSASNTVLGFDHKLTQLQFTFKSASGYPLTGYKVVSLKVKAQPTLVDMIVATGACTFSGSADMQVLSVMNQSTGLEITSAGTDALSPIMTKPASGSSAYLLDIVVMTSGPGGNISYTGIPVDVTSLVGNAHMITITFNPTEVAVSATVADWIMGAPGTAIAE